MTPQVAMLFCAGFGTRMAPLTNDRPKPLVEVAGKPLIDHALAECAAGQVGRIVVNAHYRAAQMVQHLAQTPVVVSVEAPDILETGGGLRQARPFLGTGPVFTLNTDAVWHGAPALPQLSQAWEPARMSALLLLVPPDRAEGRDTPGDFSLAADGRISRGRDLVYTGAQILSLEALETAPPGAFSLNAIWDDLAEQGRLFGTVFDGRWCDVGRPENIALAERMLRYVPR